MANRTKISAPHVKAQADGPQGSSSLAAIIRLFVGDDGRLDARPIDEGNDYSNTLAGTVTSLYGKSKQVEQARLREVLGREDLSDGLVVVVVEDGSEATDDLVRLLNDLIADPKLLTDDGIHAPHAGLLRWASVCQSGSGVVTRDADIHRLAFEIHRRGIVQEGRSQQAKARDGDIDLSKEQIQSRSLTPFEAKAHFAGSATALASARHLFQEELRSLADTSIPADQLDGLATVSAELCESLHSVLRAGGVLVDITIDKHSKSLALEPIAGAESPAEGASFRSVEVVPISALPAVEAASVLGRTLGKKQATAFFTREHQSRAGKIASEKMTAEQKTKRARKASLAASEKMTAEQKAERARKAALSRWGRKQS